MVAIRRVRDSGWRNYLRRVPTNAVTYIPMLKGGDTFVQNYAEVNTAPITAAVWKLLPSGLWYLDFDGIDDRVQYNTSVATNIAGALTVSVWVKLDVTVANQPDGIPTIICHQVANLNDRNYAIYITKATDLLSFNGRNIDGSAFIFESTVAAVGATYLDDLDWHKVTGVWDRANTTSYVYIDAVARSTDAGQTDADLETAGSQRLNFSNQRGQPDTFMDCGITIMDVETGARSTEEESYRYGQERQIIGV